MSGKRFISAILLMIVVGSGIVSAMEPQQENPFPVFPEETKLGDFLCKLTFWRGLPPCFKESVFHGGYVYYPTRQRARIIVDSFLVDGLYPSELLVSFFGSLMTGSYRPVPSVPVGDYWDSGYFALVKLDHRIQAKRLLLDIIFNRGWAKGKFLNERYKALDVVSKERLITLREYKPLVQYLKTALDDPNADFNWINSLVNALASFREWGDELLPLFRKALNRTPAGYYESILQVFLDFDIPDDSEVILARVLDNAVENIDEQKMCIRAAYVLDSEYAEAKLREFLNDEQKMESVSPELKTYIVNTLERLKWYGNWEITDTKDTVDPGLKQEKIAFKMAHTLHEKDDIVDFSMAMQLSWDATMLKPIGSDETIDTNNTSFEVTPTELIFRVYYPLEHTTSEKRFTLKEGTGRNKGRIYLQFPIPGEKDRRGKQKYGWVEIEKIS